MTEVTQHAYNVKKRKRQPTPVFSPGESEDPGGLLSIGRKESDITEAT